MAELSHKEEVPQQTCDDQQVSTDCIDSDVKEVLNELLEKASQETFIVDENLKSDPSSDILEFVEVDDNSSIEKQDNSSEAEELQSSPPQRTYKKRVRSISENESEGDTKAKESIRRKFGSEGAILSICEKIIPLEQQKELNEAIGHYIEKLIKDSILKAVKNVTVDNLCENIVHNLSDRKNSLSGESENDFVVEQRLNSNSISELVELENAADSHNGKGINCSYSTISSRGGKLCEEECLDTEFDDGTFGGYLADLEDTASMDDLKSNEESINSLNSSVSSNTEQKNIFHSIDQETSEKSSLNETESSSQDCDIANGESSNIVRETEIEEQKYSSPDQQNEPLQSNTNSDELNKPLSEDLNSSETKTVISTEENTFEHECCSDNVPKSEIIPLTENTEKRDKVIVSSDRINEDVDLIVMSPDEELLVQENNSKTDDCSNSPDLTESLPNQKVPVEEQMKVNWKVGYLQVKLPHKTRGKTNLKAWKKRRVIIQPDEFVNDPKNPSLVISVYGNDSKKHETTFWHSVSSQKAVVFRSSSRSHRFAFTISEGGDPIIHLSADKESTTQEWMAAIRSVLWPPSSFMELEKMLSGREFEVSIIDNEYSYHAGLLGMYGYLSITPKKLILLHPQQGYVIQEWYLNTVDKFHFVPQPKSEDKHKVLCMTTCSDSSTGQGQIVFFCNEAVTFLQSLASNIHEVLSYHSKQEGGKYRKELEEIAEWLVAPPQDCLTADDKADEHYKVPPRQVKSLLDIPNFIFNKSLSPVASAIYPAPNTDVLEPLDGTKNKPTTTSYDSGISTCTSGDDFLNCSVTSFVIGGGPMTGKSSDSELSDAYTPPRTPEISKKIKCEVLKEEQPLAGEA